MSKWFVHGEVNFLAIDSIPSDAKAFTPESKQVVDSSRGKSFIVGESETSGNHHLAVMENVDHEQIIEFYEKDGQTYMKVKEDTSVICLHDGRHDDMVLPSGNYKHSIAQEWDYLTEAKRNVAD